MNKNRLLTKQAAERLVLVVGIRDELIREHRIDLRAFGHKVGKGFPLREPDLVAERARLYAAMRTRGASLVEIGYACGVHHGTVMHSLARLTGTSK